MPLLKRFVFPLILLSLFALSLCGSEDPPANKKTDSEKQKKEIEWLTYDVGLKKALKEDKHVFIDFTAKWCGYCRKMEKEVFTDPRIIDLLNFDFVPVRVDGDSRRELNIDGYKITERSLTTREFGVRGYPTFWFLKPDGTKLGPIGGYRPTDFMIEALTFVKEYRYDSTSTEGEAEKE